MMKRSQDLGVLASEVVFTNLERSVSYKKLNKSLYKIFLGLSQSLKLSLRNLLVKQNKPS
jgi:hypothetical protein